MLVVWVLGLLIVFRVNRAHITATYVVSFVILSFIRSEITGHRFLAEVAPITGPMYQLFIFFMITDPKTTVRKPWAQCVVVAIVALVEFVLRLFQNIHAPYYALATVGPAAVILEIVFTQVRSVSATEKPAVAAA
jgi:Na+-translocating ferredoxin:NAD+ oxidoreductase RnfD subunit